jgi:peptide/nickel transport system ATP-binding protein
LNAIPKPTEEANALASISGSVPDLIEPPSGCRFHPRCPVAMGICSEFRPELREMEAKHQVACHVYN